MTRWAPFLLVGCWPYINQPHPLEDVGLEADTDVDVDTDADADCPTPEGSVGSDLGIDILGGNTCPGIDDYDQRPANADGTSCPTDAIPGPDVAFTWTAPSTGAFQIDLLGSNYDTFLTLRTTCPDNRQLACNDDFGGGGTTSGLVRDFVSGESVVIVVEGYGVACGNFQLNIDEYRPPAFDGH